MIRRTAKSVLSVLIVIVLLFTLTSCEKSEGERKSKRIKDDDEAEGTYETDETNEGSYDSDDYPVYTDSVSNPVADKRVCVRRDLRTPTYISKPNDMDYYTLYKYDSNGRLLQETDYSVKDNNEYSRKTYEYNTDGTVKSEAVSSNSLNVTYTYKYSGGRLVAKVSGGKEVYSYTYDSNNRIIEETDLNQGVRIAYTYDASGKVIQKDVKEAFDKGMISNTTTYFFTKNEITYYSNGDIAREQRYTSTFSNGVPNFSSSKTHYSFTYTYSTLSDYLANIDKYTIPNNNSNSSTGGSDTNSSGGSTGSTRSCSACAGQGSYKCIACDGTGKVFYKYDANNKPVYRTCPAHYCNQGRVQCQTCGGDGILGN